MRIQHDDFEALCAWTAGWFALAWKKPGNVWEGPPTPPWQACLLASREQLALETWRQWGDPASAWRPSPSGIGWRHEATPAWERRHQRRHLWSVEIHDVAALGPDGRSLCPKGLIDWGAQLAFASDEWARWELASWGWSRGWPHAGPVPGTGKGSRLARFRKPKLGDGARRRWLGEALGAVEQLDELDVWGPGAQAARQRWLGQASRIGAELTPRWEENAFRFCDRSWKRAGAKRAKAWG